jgi:hypothetical protein
LFIILVAEVALDQWTVTCDNIGKRVNRYETKAKLKKEHKSLERQFSMPASMPSSIPSSESLPINNSDGGLNDTGRSIISQLKNDDAADNSFSVSVKRYSIPSIFEGFLKS